MAERKWTNPVRTQMSSGTHSKGAPSMRPAKETSACMDYNPDPPFTKPHDVGNGGIPLKFMEHHGVPSNAFKSASPGQVHGGMSSPGYTGGQERSREKASVPKNNK